MQSSGLTHLDLFSGIGGFTIAAEWSGFETIGFAEIEPYPCAILAQHWPHIKNYGSVDHTDNFFELRGRITVLTAGVPCQPASLAGKRRGKEDNRWKWPAALSIVECVQPAWCIFENPPGILSLDEFSGVLLRLESIGYEVRAFSVPANSAGASHYRHRAFFVANLNGQGLQERKADQAQQNSRTEPERVCIREVQPELIPELLREIHGIPKRVDRIKALGNSVVPQQVAPFFSAIAQVEIR